MDNTEGSRAQIIFTVRKNQELRLNSRQAQILAGTIVGDAYIYPKGKIQIEHSTKEWDYVYWKYAELKSLAYGKPSLVQRYDKRTGKTYKSLRFWLRQYFKPLRKKFYPKGKKIFPKDFDPLDFNSLSLAVLFMDDGSYSRDMCVISLDALSAECRNRFTYLLSNRFGLRARISSNGKICFYSGSRERLIDIISPYVIPSLEYKLVP